MHVCLYVCMYVCIYVCMYAYTCTHTHPPTHTHTRMSIGAGGGTGKQPHSGALLERHYRVRNSCHNQLDHVRPVRRPPRHGWCVFFFLSLFFFYMSLFFFYMSLFFLYRCFCTFFEFWHFCFSRHMQSRAFDTYCMYVIEYCIYNYIWHNWISSSRSCFKLFRPLVCVFVHTHTHTHGVAVGGQYKHHFSYSINVAVQRPSADNTATLRVQYSTPQSSKGHWIGVFFFSRLFLLFAFLPFCPFVSLFWWLAMFILFYFIYGLVLFDLWIGTCVFSLPLSSRKQCFSSRGIRLTHHRFHTGH